MQTSLIIEKLLSHIAELVPAYMSVPDDYAIARGTVSVCIIDQDGKLYGQIFGTDKVRGRESYRIAWIKASQVWMTGYKTNEYEQLVFAGKVDHSQFGINMPDFIGWEGGQPVTLADGRQLAVGFSGFRGTSDLEIVIKALEKAQIAIK